MYMKALDMINECTKSQSLHIVGYQTLEAPGLEYQGGEGGIFGGREPRIHPPVATKFKRPFKGLAPCVSFAR